MTVITLRLDEKHVFKDHPIEVLEDNNGIKKSYNLSLDQVVDLFSEAIDNGHSSPILPKGIVHYFEKSSGWKKVWIDVAKEQRDIIYESNTITVGFPRLLFGYTLSPNSNGDGYHVTLSNILAVKGKGSITEETEVFHFPYSHVQSGNVCMGGNRLPEIHDLTKLEVFHYLFFRSPFGSDYGAKTKSKEKLSTLFLDRFNGKSFDDNELISFNQTFSEWIN